MYKTPFSERVNYPPPRGTLICCTLVDQFPTVVVGPPDRWSIGRLTCSYYPRKLSFIHSHVPYESTVHATGVVGTGYLGLPAEMANILLRPPTHSVTRSLGSLLFGVPRTHMITLSLDTYSLRVIIVIYAPTTNVTSLICPSRLILRSC
ncbi:PREDICTED: LOW QUALITY PROTEIN: uncharacterized protein LOC107185913 [Dufourea novaeangliae]|uniref:LOW QUALITY PROTEIN: uncharacterized protein LOC107185913 n=1 Tax=Dufourea novaeangliae TaxID=178035 RepID=UPI000767916D|nr:PREDICTED: LOW QUALITY PROTEIN: uncharacterized protein LOC107185913 [Dufourea novaeangliae]